MSSSRIDPNAEPAPETSSDRQTRLQAERDAAAARVQQLEAEYAELLDNRDVIQEDRDTVRRILEEARGILAAAERSLAQEATGTYGRCSVCGGEIGAERLEALPDTTTCRACA